MAVPMMISVTAPSTDLSLENITPMQSTKGVSTIKSPTKSKKKSNKVSPLQPVLPDQVSSTLSKKSSTSSSTKTTSKSTKKKGKNHEAPIFLRKTYHMVDSCDPSIASWSDDGHIFIVKDPDQFAAKVIPQFFKHSNFASFVRQLNFYGFRKLRNHDSIRIDPDLDARTANFWRFRHEHFQRGRPDLLIEIKRSSGQITGINNVSHEEGNGDIDGMKTEMEKMKDEIAKMSNEIEKLTSMMNELKVERSDDVSKKNMRNKRMKVEQCEFEEREMEQDEVIPDAARSDSSLRIDQVSSVGSGSMDESFSFSPSRLFPVDPMLRQRSTASVAISDNEFVDELYDAFENGDDTFLDELETRSVTPPLIPDTLPLPDPMEDYQPTSIDPRLVKKVSDSLSTLSKDVQEMLVDRLVSSITNSDIQLQDKTLSNNSQAVQSRIQEQKPKSLSGDFSCDGKTQKIDIPLACATLKAFLSQYGMTIKDHDSFVKRSPVVPVHA